MLKNIIPWFFKPVKFRFLLPLIYLLLILLIQLIFLNPSSKDECVVFLSSTAGCIRTSFILTELLGLPGYFTINLFGILFPSLLKFWVSLSDQNQGFFLITIYELTIFLIYIFGLIFDKITAAFSPKKVLNRV